MYHCNINIPSTSVRLLLYPPPAPLTINYWTRWCTQSQAKTTCTPTSPRPCLEMMACSTSATRTVRSSWTLDAIIVGTGLLRETLWELTWVVLPISLFFFLDTTCFTVLYAYICIYVYVYLYLYYITGLKQDNDCSIFCFCNIVVMVIICEWPNEKGMRPYL